MKFFKPRKDTVIACKVVIDHISKVKNEIQVPGVEIVDAGVKLLKRKGVITSLPGRTVAVLAVGEDPHPDPLLALHGKWQEKERNQKMEIGTGAKRSSAEPNWPVRHACFFSNIMEK